MDSFSTAFNLLQEKIASWANGAVLLLPNFVISILTGVGIIGIALGFAFQDMAANFISGIALVFRDDRPFKVGDIVETNGQMGVVREINLRAS